MSPIWDRDEDFSPDFEEIAAGTSMFEKRYAPVVLTCQKFDRYAVFDSSGSWGESGERFFGWERSADSDFIDALAESLQSEFAPASPRTLSGFMSDFADGWDSLGLPNPESGMGLPPHRLFEEYVFMLPALVARRVKPLGGVAGSPSATSGRIRAIGDRYRLRGPLSGVDQHRQFLKVTWTQTSGFDPILPVEYAAWALMDQEPTSVEVVTLTILAGALYSDPPHDVVPQHPAPQGSANAEVPHSQVGEYLKVVRLLPVEIEIKHTEKGRDDQGNELTTTINPGATTLLRDEIADLRIKVPTVGNADWDMKLELEPADMKTQTLDSRGAVQMYDFGTIDPFGTITPLTTNANGTTKAGPYDIKLLAGNSGDETFKIVVNKEGKFKLRLKSADNKIDVLSQEFTVTKRIRKYARRPENNNADFDKNDKAFVDAAEAWGSFYKNPLDPDILKAMGIQESTLGYGETPTTDILTINYGGNDQDHVLAILHKEHATNEREAIPGGDNGWTIRWLDYDDAAAGSARVAIHWGTCWLFHKAQKGRFVSAPNSPPHYVTFGGWNTWETAVGYYGPNPVYLGVIEGPWKRGRRDSTTGKVGGVWKKIDFAESNFQYLWPILTNHRPRK